MVKYGVFDNYLTVNQFAKRACVTGQAVRKMIKFKKLEAMLLGNQYIIPKEEFNRYLKRRR